MKKIFIIFLVLLFSCSKESTGGGDDALLAQNAALNAQIATLNAQIASLNIEISSLNSQVAEASPLQEILDSKTAELNIAVANYENAIIDISELEETVTSLINQLGEFLDTIEFWLSQVAGNYEFELILDGVDSGSYVWEIGLTEDNEAIWNTYYWDGTCYRKNNASSLGEESNAYFSDASLDDLGIIAYNVPASNVGITGYETVITWDTFTRTSDGGLLAMLDVYDNSWNLLRRLQNIDGPLYASINITFCEPSSSAVNGDSSETTETDDSSNSGDGSDNTPVVEPDNIYLDSNGVTIKATADAQVGDQETINGEVYTVVDKSTLLNKINSGENVGYVVTSLITDMSSMFYDTPFNQDISSWDVSNVTNMFDLFRYSTFNGDISNWDVSNVTVMQGMFSYSPFNGDISSWDVSNVTNMYLMFDNSSFNGDISNWDVSNVVNMQGMFSVTNFNGDISNWDVSNVTNMSYLFYSTQFNGDVSNWDVSSVTNMSYMFSSATSFNQDISSWNVSNVTNCANFSNGASAWSLSKPNFINCDPD